MPTIPELVREAWSHWDDARVLSRTGRELHDRNRLDLARAVLAHAVELDETDAEAWAHLAYAHLRAMRDGEARDILRRGIERSGSHRLHGALASFTEDAEEKERALATVDESPDAGARAAAASIRFTDGDDRSFDVLRRLHEQHPDDGHVRETWLWTLLGARDRAPEGFDAHRTAVELCDRAIAEDPGRVFPYWIKAESLFAARDWDGLLASTQAALAHCPDEETQMFLRGRAWKEKGEPERAAACFARAIGMKPSYAGARVQLGRTLEELGRLDEAEEVFREIGAANPGYAAGPVSLALFLGRRERWDEAEAAFLAAWAKLPGWMHGHLERQPEIAAMLERPRVKAAVAASQE